MTDGGRYVLCSSSPLNHAKMLASLTALYGGREIVLFGNNPDMISSLESVPLYIRREGFDLWSICRCSFVLRFRSGTKHTHSHRRASLPTRNWAARGGDGSASSGGIGDPLWGCTHKLGSIGPSAELAEEKSLRACPRSEPREGLGGDEA